MAVAYIVMVGAAMATLLSYSLTLHRIIICIMMAQISHSKAVPQSMPVTVVCGVLMISALLLATVDWFTLLIMSGYSAGLAEPYGGAVITGASGFQGPGTAQQNCIINRYRYMQLYTTGWFTIGYA
jgi:hypothetical protein